MDLDDLWFIYVCRCQESKYYIGKTKNLDRRISAHLSVGHPWAVAFIRKYPLLQDDPLEAVYYNRSSFV